MSMTPKSSVRATPGLAPMAGMLVALAAALAGGASPADAQQADERWAPWMGCWEPAPGFAGPSLCARETDGGVEFVRVAEGEVVERRTVRADGVPAPFDEEGCSGETTASFSADGARVYVQSVVTCEGGAQQTSSGILAMVGSEEWVDVQAVDVGGRTAVGVQRFRTGGADAATVSGIAAAPQEGAYTRRVSRLAASAPVGVDEVIEASAAVEAAAVEAWLAESGQPMELSAALLLRMADAGVDPSTIDVVVAVSNPEHFVLDGAGAAMITEAGARPGDRSAYGAGPYAGTWYGGTPFGYGYGSRSYYGYGSGYYGMGGYYGFGPAYSYRPTVIVVDRQPTQQGRRVRGQGYQNPGASGQNPPARGARPREAGPERRESPPASAAPSSAPSTQRGTPTGRTAQPRPGGSRPGGGGGL